MSFYQNEKIAKSTSQTLNIGVDIAKFKHVARAQDYISLLQKSLLLPKNPE
ncbi:hypothetical protein [Robertmurraya sp. P23]|uniref:hypothetical protein n=1 Tax=Robertmurraya sp. P23 TaxID=3436931 RepID=UPI003D99D892